MTIICAIDWDEPVHPWYDYAHDAAVEAGLADPDGEPPTKWDPTTVYGCDLQAWYDAIDNEVRKGPKGLYGRPIKPGIRWQFQRLARRDIEIHVVTARGQFGSLGEQIKELTLQQITREKLPVTQVHFTKNKLPVLKKIDADFYLDDRTNYVEEALANHIGAYLLDERWNQDAPPSIPRVFSTREFVDKVCAYHDNNLREGRFVLL